MYFLNCFENIEANIFYYLGNNGPQMQPIQISVNHPFIFFIVDRDLDVAVMAGRILNPLNVRIQ